MRALVGFILLVGVASFGLENVSALGTLGLLVQQSMVNGPTTYERLFVKSSEPAQVSVAPAFVPSRQMFTTIAVSDPDTHAIAAGSATDKLAAQAGPATPSQSAVTGVGHVSKAGLRFSETTAPATKDQSGKDKRTAKPRNPTKLAATHVGADKRSGFKLSCKSSQRLDSEHQKCLTVRSITTTATFH